MKPLPCPDSAPGLPAPATRLVCFDSFLYLHSLAILPGPAVPSKPRQPVSTECLGGLPYMGFAFKFQHLGESRKGDQAEGNREATCFGHPSCLLSHFLPSLRLCRSWLSPWKEGGSERVVGPAPGRALWQLSQAALSVSADSFHCLTPTSLFWALIKGAGTCLGEILSFTPTSGGTLIWEQAAEELISDDSKECRTAQVHQTQTGPDGSPLTLRSGSRNSQKLPVNWEKGQGTQRWAGYVWGRACS